MRVNAQPAERSIVARRRELVARARLRGASIREVVDALARGGLANPRTGRPFSLGCVAKDLAVMESQWRERAAADVAAHKARTLAELAEVKRAAWQQEEPDLGAVLRALKQEAELLGLDAPTELRQRVQFGLGEVLGLDDLSDDELRARLEGAGAAIAARCLPAAP